MSKMTTEANTFNIVRTNNLILLALVLMYPIMLVGVIFPGYQLLCLATSVMFVITIPLLGKRDVDLFSIWIQFCFTAVIGVFLRTVYITFDIPNPDVIQDIFLMRETKEFLLWPMILVLLGVTFMTMGYLSGKSRPVKLSLKIFRSDRWNESRLLVSMLTMLAISWIGMYLFVTKTAEEMILEKISGMRGVSSDLSEYNAYGYLRWMAQLADFVFLICVVKLSTIPKKNIIYLVMALLSILSSMLFYTYVSTRSGVVVILIYALAIGYYLKRKTINLIRLIITIIAVMIIFKTLTILRFNNDIHESFSQIGNPMSFLEPAILATNMIDVSKTGHIISAIPVKIEYQLGNTYFPVLYSWIPRSIWRDKPITNIDTILGFKVFGAKTYGAGAVPPGIVAESYLNYSMFGVITLCFIAGYCLKVLQATFDEYSWNRNIILLYVNSVMTLGGNIAGSGFGQVLQGSLMVVLPLYLVLHVVTENNN